MTYGVDECRVCGRPMKPSGPEALLRHLSSVNARPTMTEKQWRAAGFKAAPTKRQMTMMHTGCCFDCSYKMGMKMIPQAPLIYPALIIMVVFIVLVFMFGARFT